MAKTKLSIMGLKTLGGNSYAVGQSLAEDGADLTVKEIVYNRVDCPYNKGFQLAGASYTIKFEGNDNLRVLVPQAAVMDIVIVRTKIEEEANPEAVGLVE
jgi:hypothetical protein